MARLFVNPSATVISTSQYITMATGAGVLQPAAPLTLACWVNLTNFTQFQFIAGNLNVSDNGYGIVTQLSPAGQLGYRVSGLIAGATLSTGVWYHLAMTLVSTTVSGYVNGTFDTSGSTTGLNYNGSSSTSTFGVGARQNSSDNKQCLNGSVADVALWNVGLTVTEIASLAKGVRPFQIRPQSLAGYWPLAGLQSPEPDLSSISSSKNNGTLTNTQAGFGPPLAPTPTTRNRSFMLFSPTPPRIYGIAGFASAEW